MLKCLRAPVLGIAAFGVSATLGCGESKSSAEAGAGGSGGNGAGGSAAGTAGAQASGGVAGSGGAAGSGASGGASGSGAGGAGGTGGGSGGSSGAAGEAGNGGGPVDFVDCGPLGAPPDDAIVVTPAEADQLPGIVRGAPEGAVIVLEDGTYTMTGGDEASRRLQILTPGITLRGASGDRSAVIIDGEYLTNEIITVSASGVVLADFTVTRAVDHPIHIFGGESADIDSVVLHNLHIVDGGEQFVKVNTGGSDPLTYADLGIVQCSLFELTDAGRPNVERSTGGCYTGGIDVHQARGWAVRRNTFRGIYCETEGLAEHAIHFWRGSRDTMVEQNVIINCARGIGFGLGEDGGGYEIREYADDPYPGMGFIGHYAGVIRNNFISISEGATWFDSGIELEQARGTRVYHNSIMHPASAWASISHRWANTEVEIANNILVSIKERDGSVANASTNLTDASADLFLDRDAHDLHLAPDAAAAIDQGMSLDEAGNDIDGEPHHPATPELGADEVN